MTRDEIDLHLEDIIRKLRETQQDSNKQADAAVMAEANYREKLLKAMLKPDVMKLKTAALREAMAEEMVRDEWLAMKLAQNHANTFKELMKVHYSELSARQTQGRLLISDMEFERSVRN